MALRHGVYDTDSEHFIIDPITREMQAVGYQKSTLIQGDHNSERMTFEIPKTVEGHPMDRCDSVYVHFVNIDAQTKEQSADAYEVTDLQVSATDANTLVFSWLVPRSATQYVGNLSFLVRFACTEDDGTESYTWNTAVYKEISVSDGIFNGEMIAEEYSNILEQWHRKLIGTAFSRAYINDDTLVIDNSASDELGDLEQKINTEAKAREEADTALKDAVDKDIAALNLLLNGDPEDKEDVGIAGRVEGLENLMNDVYDSLTLETVYSGSETENVLISKTGLYIVDWEAADAVGQSVIFVRNLGDSVQALAGVMLGGGTTYHLHYEQSSKYLYLQAWSRDGGALNLKTKPTISRVQRFFNL